MLKTIFKNFKPLLFAGEAIFFGLTQVLGIIAGIEFYKLIKAAEIQTEPIRIIDLLIFLIIASAFILLFGRLSKTRWFFKFIFILVIFIGIQTFLSLFINGIWPSLIAFLIILIRLSVPSIIIHNLTLSFAIAPVGAILGVNFSPLAAIILLIVLSTYDFIAVYKTKHMVKMAKEMIEGGALFVLVLPEHRLKIKEHAHKARPGEGFFFLGAGDLSLPLVFAVSALQTGIFNAIMVAIFSIIGLALTHILFTSQEKRQPMPALPPIALMAIVGYLVSVGIQYIF